MTELPPPWIKFPDIPLGSLGWRMGAGEDYWYLWQDWFVSLPKTDQTAFRNKFPEPEKWNGFYGRTLEDAKNRAR